MQAAFATSSQRVFPTGYAYYGNSVTMSERSSANCMNYPPGMDGVHSQHYIHCNGIQLRLNDSETGPVLQYYDPSYYYEWRASETQIRQLLFIFSTRVNLTTITLHYYSSSQRGLPLLRFYAVPNDFNVWHAPSSSYDKVTVAAIPAGSQLFGNTNISIDVNFKTTKVLMVKAGSTYKFGLSEVEFTSCFDGKIISNYGLNLII